MLHDFFNTMLQGAESAVHSVGGFLGAMVNGNKVTYDRAADEKAHPVVQIATTTDAGTPAVTPVTTPSQKTQIDNTALLAAIRYQESRGEKKPYSFYQPSGDPKLGDALGAYQFTQAKINEQSKSLGYDKPPTREEFLSNPALQDEFAGKLINKLKGFGFDAPTILAAHRGGFSDRNNMAAVVKSRQGYVDEGMKKYNELTSNQ